MQGCDVQPDDSPQYGAGLAIHLIELSSDTRVLIACAVAGLQAIYKTGYQNKKAGVLLMDLSDASVRQGTLFESFDAENATQIMAALGTVNKRFDRDTLRVGSGGTTKRWSANADFKTPCFTTRWTDVPIAKAD